LLLALAVALTYANSLGVDFIYDDFAFVVNNETIRTFAEPSKFIFSPEAFAQPANDHVFRPLVSFTFAVNYALGALDVRGYHLTNILFHTLNAFLLYVFLRRIGLQGGASLAGAMIFAIHPAHVEAVTWISGRGNVLFLSFFLISLLLYMKLDAVFGWRRAAHLCGAVAAYAVSLAAKEMAMPLPALLIGYDLYFCRKADGSKSDGDKSNAEKSAREFWLPRLRLYIPFALTALLYLALRTHVLGKIGQVAYHGDSAYMTFLLMLKALAIYARLLAVPVGLSLVRHFHLANSIFEPQVIIPLVCVVSAVVVGIAALRRAPLLSFGLFWFAVAILPVSNIIPVNAIVADRFLYGPSIGFCILVAAWFQTALGRGSDKWSHERKILAAAALAPLIFFFMLLSVGRNNDFANPAVLWQKTLKNSPRSFVAYNNLGFHYMREGMLREAIEALKKTIDIKDDMPQAHFNLAMCYDKAGDPESAIGHYRKAVSFMENAGERAEARFRLAVILDAKGRAGQAMEQYEAALVDNPSHTDARHALDAYRAREN
jgi:tetratricopeptide (TPR) repeat protein